MVFFVGDTVEVCARKGAPWFEGVVEQIVDIGYLVRFTDPPLSSKYLKLERPAGRDYKVTTVVIPKHLVTIGVAWQSIKLKSRKK